MPNAPKPNAEPSRIGRRHGANSPPTSERKIGSIVEAVAVAAGEMQGLSSTISTSNGMHNHAGMAMPMMPGMLSPEEMQRLAAATGAEFDRLFLEGMIKHHGGALTMVKDLLDTPGAAQESEVFAFVSDVEADQRMEIDRMGAMLNAIAKERQR